MGVGVARLVSCGRGAGSGTGACESIPLTPCYNTRFARLRCASITYSDPLPMRSFIIFKLTLILFTAALLGGCVSPPEIKTSAAAPLSVPTGVKSRPLGLGPVVTRINPDESSVGVRYSWFGRSASLPRLPPDAALVTRGDMVRVFDGVLAPLGYQLQKKSSSVFEPSAVPDLVLGGSISKVVADAWHLHATDPSYRGGLADIIKGHATLDITWEVFDTSTGHVIYTSKVVGRFEADGSVPGGVSSLILNAYVDSLKGLVAEPAFRDAILNSKPAVKDKGSAA